jgi:hypothetical protein
MKREKFILPAQRSGKTERIREEVKAAIERGENIYMPDTPPVAPENGEDDVDGQTTSGGEK